MHSARREAVIRRKHERLLDGGNKARALDLFAGCGGLSCGAQLAGLQILGGVEVDPSAAATHHLNFSLPDRPTGVGRGPLDITQIRPAQVIEAWSGEPTAEAVDILMGGPPCQAFARIGRAKLRSERNHPEAYLSDARSRLYLNYLEFVEELAPLGVIMENVPDALNYGGVNVFDKVRVGLERLGYSVRYGLLNAAHFGVPQFRLRAFLIAVPRFLQESVFAPEGTHAIEVPNGYRAAEKIALRYCEDNLYSGPQHWLWQSYTQGSLPAVTVEEAIGDLPELVGHMNGRHKLPSLRAMRARPMQFVTPGPAEATTYSRLMREWPGFEGTTELHDHVSRNLPRDHDTFARMRPGDQYPQAFRVAECRYREKCEEIGVEDCPELYRQIVPPYDPRKFPNKWRKLIPGAPSWTLTAHLGKDSYSHIHYDDHQGRTITVREAARLQSFPDGFRFAGSMNDAFRQIGNAVPPLLAHGVVRSLLHSLRGRRPHPNRVFSRFLKGRAPDPVMAE
jgi:DNA (cytosine-5)-methyltransferase 1